MKKAIALIITAVLLLSLCSCSDKPEQKKSSETKAAETTAPETTTEAKKVETLNGIDVSAYSGDIDWSGVKTDFVMVRLGGRGYGDSGTLYADDNAAENLRNAKANGIRIGAYFYSQAINEDEAREEADYALGLLGEIKLDLYLAYDFEYIKDDDARTDKITVQQRKKITDAFCGRIAENGVEPMVYGYAEDFEKGFDTGYPIWLADYEGKSDVKYTMLQTSNEGKVDGIEGSVDTDILRIEN